MSLMYRALQQTEQRSAGVIVPGLTQASTAPPVVEARLRQPNRSLLPGVGVAAAALALLAAGLTVVLVSRIQPVNAVVPAYPLAGVAEKVVPVALGMTSSSSPADVVVPPRQMDKLPTMELAVPIASLPAKLSPPRIATTAPMAPSAVTPIVRPITVRTPVVPPLTAAKTSVSASVAKPDPVLTAVTATPLASAVVAAAIPAPATKDTAVRPEPVAVNVTIPELFEVFNRALLDRDIALAKRQLALIQSNLPEFSIARLRAEAWFSQQTADTEGARRLYLRLLEKLPGDEAASVNLATIERAQLRFDAAKEALTKGLRNNPNSAVLRAALDQIAQSAAPK